MVRLSNDHTIQKAKSFQYFFHRQWLHFLFIAMVIMVLRLDIVPFDFTDTTFRALNGQFLFRLSIYLVIVHQVLVWIVFRGQMGFGFLNRLLNKYALKMWLVIFMGLLISRPLVLMMVASATRGSLSGPTLLYYILALICVGLTLVTFYGVWRYFGLYRAIGGDHFDVKYRQILLVRKGVFSVTPNAMYWFGFLLLWAIALYFQSVEALGLAAFQHLYIWLHYYVTEKPDMQLIYGKQRMENE